MPDQERNAGTLYPTRNPENREVKIRSLAVLPVLALGCLSLVGCDSKAGSAAVVGGTKISESDLASYLPANAPAIPTNNGQTSTPARIFVLQLLVQNRVFPLLLAAGGKPVTDAELDAAKSNILQGQPEQALIDQIAKVGLKAKFEQVYLRNQELTSFLQKNLTTAKQQQAALAGVKGKVSINPRYGSWDDQSVALVDLGKKQLPSVLTLNDTLPGDVKAPTGQ
ncbi:MAG: hypothetical protein M3Y42_12525 [Actinomycetota bacterium]|nr:hypothetical protein [Actinomycetota bacterium]MDQ2957778.1 hypothetical protein [Actinomycetota bacterium]